MKPIYQPPFMEAPITLLITFVRAPMAHKTQALIPINKYQKHPCMKTSSINQAIQISCQTFQMLTTERDPAPQRSERVCKHCLGPARLLKLCWRNI